MTIRNTIVAAVLAAALVSPGLPAQDLSPDSLARLGLPADPSDFARQLVSVGRPVRDLFAAGCPSGGGWAASAFAALESAAETDPSAHKALVYWWAKEQRFARRKELGTETIGPRCPSDSPREAADVWLAGELRGLWEGGRLEASPDWESGEADLIADVFEAMPWATAPEAFEVVRDIARDPAVWEPWREDAAGRLVDLYFGEGDRDSPRPGGPEMVRWVGAWQSMALDLAAGAPLPDMEWNARYVIVQNSSLEARDAFEREYEQALRAAGRGPFWK